MCFLKMALSLVLIAPYIFSVSAHPGHTDGNGGHWNRSTGEYHYHHGYSEHQHVDGVCPYDFDDKTGQNTGENSNSENRIASGDYKAPIQENSVSESSGVSPALLFCGEIGLLYAGGRCVVGIKKRASIKVKIQGEQKMKCSACGNFLPEDSEFCQYCGEKIIVPLEPQCFCRHCGEPMESAARKCPSCGKEVSHKAWWSIVLISVLCVISIALNAYQYNSNLSTKEKLEQANSVITEQEQLLSQKNSTISKQDIEIKRLKKQNANDQEKAEFMDDYVVLVGDSNNKYHKYGCEDLDLSYFYAFNTEAAISRGHEACKKCN